MIGIVFVALTLLLAMSDANGRLQDAKRKFRPTNELPSPTPELDDGEEQYLNSWAVKIKGGPKVADRIARENGFLNLGPVGVFEDLYHFQKIEEGFVRSNAPFNSNLEDDKAVEFADQQIRRKYEKKSYAVPQDAHFSNQWHLLNTIPGFEGRDLQVEKAWMQGLTGCNVSVTIVDDGLDYKHPDLWPNFVPSISYDVLDNDMDPLSYYNSHGTNCGGVAGAAQNEHCGVGIAPHVNLGGIRLLGRFGYTDMGVAIALSYERNTTDIYSNSWGPPDSGLHSDKPAKMAKMALKEGVTKGREGKGSIIVWANGNGGLYHDDCGADGFASSIYTISVGAIGMDGWPSYFDEECSAKMVMAYITNMNESSDVVAPETGGFCTKYFGGTSAATPMVSGVIALTLEANPNLTWRDVQYLIVYTANPDLTNNINMTKNGAGLVVSRQYGFGVMDAEAMVSRARHWINVPPQIEDHFTQFTLISVPGVTYSATLTYSGGIRYLEHVVVEMSISIPFNFLNITRGSLEIELTSPFGTKSVLLMPRPLDVPRPFDMPRPFDFGYEEEYPDWPFMSVMFWGEDPRGQWTLSVKTDDVVGVANISNVSFVFYGVSGIPESVRNIPKTCHSDCKRGCAGNSSDECDSCNQLRDAYNVNCIDQCPDGYTERNGYCYDASRPLKECDSPLKSKEGSGLTPDYNYCAQYGYTECCTYTYCDVYINSTTLCYCDALCFAFEDCCNGVADIGCIEGDAGDLKSFPFIELGSTPNVMTKFVQPYFYNYTLYNVLFPFTYEFETELTVADDGTFEFGVIDKRVLVFQTYPSVVNESSSSTYFEVHEGVQSENVLSFASNIVNVYQNESFLANWLLVATWHFQSIEGLENIFQGILLTDYVSSYAVFTYNCDNMTFSSPGRIGYFDYSNGGISTTHPASYRDNPHKIACINEPKSPWVNIVYKLSQTDNECEYDNGGCEQVCTDTFLSYTCSCTPGYTLDSDLHNCTDINECATGDDECKQICINTVGSYFCGCQEGFVLDSDGYTCNDTDECNSTDHGCEQECINLIGSYVCNCSAGYELNEDGLNCDDINECATGDNKCKQICNNTIGSYTCGCWEGFVLDSDGYTCNDINECNSTDHGCEQECINLIGSYVCNCTTGYELNEDSRKCDDIDECNSTDHGCEQECINLIGSYVCNCTTGYELNEDGLQCNEIDECKTNQHECEQNCTNTEGSYICSCRDGYILNDNRLTCSISCGGTLTNIIFGSFQTPDWPNFYPSEDFTCEWILHIDISTSIDIQFNAPFGIYGSEPCSSDYVEVISGEEGNTISRGKFCGVNVPDDISIDSNRVTVVFKGSSSSQMDRAGISVSYKASVTALPFILNLDVRPNIVPRHDDAISQPVPLPLVFPFGGIHKTTVYVGTNGYLTFSRFTGFRPFRFAEGTGLSIVAPFFTDIDISRGHGEIFYHIYNETDTLKLSIANEINNFISVNLETNFTAKWLLIASWIDVTPYGKYNKRGSFQAVLATDYMKTYVIFIYKCDEGLEGFTKRATIGFVREDGLYAYHEASSSSDPLQFVSCLNNPYTNIIYEISGDLIKKKCVLC